MTLDDIAESIGTIESEQQPDDVNRFPGESDEAVDVDGSNMNNYESGW